MSGSDIRRRMERERLLREAAAKKEAIDNPKPTSEPSDALVSDETIDKVKEAGRFAVLGGKWAAGKAKDLAQAAAEKARQAKAATEDKLAQQRQAKQARIIEDETRKANALAREAEERESQERVRQELNGSNSAHAVAVNVSAGGEVEGALKEEEIPTATPTEAMDVASDLDEAGEEAALVDPPDVGAAPDEPAVEADSPSAGSSVHDSVSTLATGLREDPIDAIVPPGASEFPLVSPGDGDTRLGEETSIAPTAQLSPRTDAKAVAPALIKRTQRASIPRAWLYKGVGALIVVGLLCAGFYMLRGADEAAVDEPTPPVDASVDSVAPLPAPASEPHTPVVAEDVPGPVLVVDAVESAVSVEQSSVEEPAPNEVGNAKARAPEPQETAALATRPDPPKPPAQEAARPSRSNPPSASNRPKPTPTPAPRREKAPDWQDSTLDRLDELMKEQ